MTVTETLNEGLKRGYEVRIPAEAIARRVDAAIAKVAPQVRMPGFRPGKVPGNLIRRMHGEALRREAVTEAVNEAVTGLLTERGLRPAMQPTIDMTSGLGADEDVTIGIALEVLPQVPEAEVEGIALEKLVAEPTEAEIDAALARLAEQQKRFEDAPAGHAAATGDLVGMDYAGSIDGKAFDGGAGEGMEVELGSGRLIPGFEDGLVGVRAGDQRSVEVTFPADYPVAELAGRSATFAVTVHAVKVPVVPEIDEALATNLGLESLDKLKDILKDQVEAELSSLTRTHMKRKLLDHLAAGHDFEVPASMVDAEFETIWRQVESETPEDERAGMEAERDEYRRIAERRVRLGLLLSDIGQRHGIQVSPQEMNRLVAQEAARFPGQEREVQKYFAENAMAAAQLRAPLYEEKVVDFLLGKASLTERTVSRAELEQAIASEDETPTAAAAAKSRAPATKAAPKAGADPSAPRPARSKAKPAKPADTAASDGAGDGNGGETGAPAARSSKARAQKPQAASADVPADTAERPKKPRAKKSAGG